MKKIILLCMLSVLPLVGMGCSNESEAIDNNKQNKVDVKEQKELSEDEDVRKVVWTQLPSDQIDFIDGTWEDGTISKVKLTGDMFAKQSNEMNTKVGEDVDAIEFPTKSTSSTNNVIVYADIESQQYIWNGLAD
ncbi:hypothetical protein [Guptibacillus spartinae]|uniref:hypothetical protein n=1 Tax=Guptibacillus spartinae TaxID=3025679 RepID=UPI00235E7FB6|nr:hypothetical protein [Pseudalkalibacillus spartinae]